MICQKCKKEILPGEEKLFIAMDRPKYMNIWFHRECIKNYSNAYKYVNDNIDEIAPTRIKRK